MSDNPLSFLSEAPASNDAPVITSEPAAEPAAAPTPEATPEASTAPVRDDKGRFAPKAVAEPAPAATPEPVQAAAPDPTPDPVDPVAAAIKAAEDRIRAEYDKKIGGLQTALSAKRAEVREARKPPPEYFTAEDRAYVSEIEAEAEQRAFDRLAQASFNRFAKANGEDQAKQVAAWAGKQSQLDPTFNTRLLESDDPLETAFEAYQEDPAQQIKALKEQIAALTSGAPNPAPANPAASPASAPDPRPTSIATAPSGGGPAHIPTGPGEAYRALPI